EAGAGCSLIGEEDGVGCAVRECGRVLAVAVPVDGQGGRIVGVAGQAEAPAAVGLIAIVRGTDVGLDAGAAEIPERRVGRQSLVVGADVVAVGVVGLQGGLVGVVLLKIRQDVEEHTGIGIVWRRHRIGIEAVAGGQQRLVGVRTVDGRQRDVFEIVVAL